MTVSTDLPAMERAMEHVARSLHGIPTRKRIDISAEQIGYYLGLFAVPILFGLLVVSIVAYMLAKRRKRRATAD
jgi:galactitol-specific phosphotransferase system IIC component